MTEPRKAQVLLVGIEDALLWQLTRVLAAADDRIETQCARDLSVAAEICADRAFDVVVVDGWEQSWQAGYSMGWDRLSGMRPRRWVILVESIPMEGLFDDRISASVVFLEKPFNPKELPAFLLRALRDADADEGRPGAQVAMAGGTLPEPGLPKKDFLVPGERYRAAACDQTPVAAPEPPRTAEPAPASDAETAVLESPKTVEPVPAAKPKAAVLQPQAAFGASGQDFHALLEAGFACVKAKDYTGAQAHWSKALTFYPQDKRLQANLRNLKKHLPAE